jgi:UDP-N-acetylmuramoyl-tripeptide--D-alanyl-D-alanine ligase
MQYTSVEDIYTAFLKADQLISTDTRKLPIGSVFFALKGANFDGNEFAQKALDAGCSAVVADNSKWQETRGVMVVPDVLAALQELAKLHRSHLTIPVLAITGSNGKTTNKELIKAVLSKKFNVLATQGNLNNHIGVPLTLLSIRPEHEFAVIEMGANHQGEIRDLCAIADPEFGLITNIGKAHLEGFGGEEGVKKGKGELFDHLRNKGGKAIVNGDDAVLSEMAFSNDKITFGCNKLYDLIGKDCSHSEMVSFKFTTRYGEKNFAKLPQIDTHIIGHYNLNNCLAAACIGNYFKVEDSDIRAALANYVPDMNRSQLVKTVHNTLILDAYNANPDSMKAALINFAKYPSDKKLVLLGDMFELGDYAIAEHQAIVTLLRSLHLKNACLVGKVFAKIPAADFLQFESTDECLAHLQTHKIEGHAVLIKGSRGMKMETLQNAL